MMSETLKAQNSDKYLLTAIVNVLLVFQNNKILDEVKKFKM